MPSDRSVRRDSSINQDPNKIRKSKNNDLSSYFSFFYSQEEEETGGETGVPTGVKATEDEEKAKK